MTAPDRSNQSCEQGTFLLTVELHNSWGLKLLSNPLTLFQVVDKHELDSDVLAVGALRTETTDGAQRKRTNPKEPAQGGFTAIIYSAGCHPSPPAF